MPSDKNDNLPTSSVVTKAMDAKTFAELEAFVKDLESRPTERLLRDLPELAALPEAKVSIISYVIATKFRHADADGRSAILQGVSGILEGLPEGEAHHRILGILGRLQALGN